MHFKVHAFYQLNEGLAKRGPRWQALIGAAGEAKKGAQNPAEGVPRKAS